MFFILKINIHEIRQYNSKLCKVVENIYYKQCFITQLKKCSGPSDQRLSIGVNKPRQLTG